MTNEYNEYANLANTREVDVTAPNGKIIRCIERGTVLIARSKVELYGMGKVTFPRLCPFSNQVGSITIQPF